MRRLLEVTTGNLQFYECRHGLLCHSATDQVIGASLRIYGEWAEEELWLLSQFVEPGDTVLDLGANVGTHALAFSRFTGPSGRVVAIDAQARAFRMLSLNLLSNQADWVVPIHAMISTTASLQMLPEHDENNENWGAVSFMGIGDRINDTGTLMLPLPAISIDSLKLGRCDLIKMDIEGMEFEALIGSPETLRQHRPTVYFEQTTDRNFASTCKIFDDLNYQLFWHVARPFNVANFRHNHRNLFGDTREVNVLAIPRERGSQERLQPFLAFPVLNGEYAPPLAAVDAYSWALPAGAYDRLSPPSVYSQGKTTT